MRANSVLELLLRCLGGYKAGGSTRNDSSSLRVPVPSPKNWHYLTGRLLPESEILVNLLEYSLE